MRKLLTAASVVSSLLCLATAVLWARSYNVPNQTEILYQGHGLRLLLNDRYLGYLGPPQRPIKNPPSSGAVPPQRSKQLSPTMVWLRLRTLFLFTLLLTVSQSLHSTLKRKPKANHCPTCHYNLTGNTSGTCPECGTKMAEKPVERVQPSRQRKAARLRRLYRHRS